VRYVLRPRGWIRIAAGAGAAAAAIAGCETLKSANDVGTAAPADAASTSAIRVGDADDAALTPAIQAGDDARSAPPADANGERDSGGPQGAASGPPDGACPDASEAMCPGSIVEYPLPADAGIHPVAITPGSDGALWFAWEFTPDSTPSWGIPGNTVGRISTSGMVSTYPILSAYAGPIAIAGSSQGTIWVAEFSADLLARVALGPNPAVVEWPIPSDGGQPNGIALDSTGQFMWFTEDVANTIGRIPAGGGNIAEFPIPTRKSWPAGIVAGADGNMWFAEQTAGAVGRVSPDGAMAEFPVPQGNPAVSSITWGPDGALWFTDPGNNAIGRITTSGSLSEFRLASLGTGPAGIVAGPDGNLWFAEAGTNRIGRITTQGDIVEVAVPTTGASPQGIAVGPDGCIWFTETGANQIGRLVPW
jgi:streptogramin lyase